MTTITWVDGEAAVGTETIIGMTHYIVPHGSGHTPVISAGLAGMTGITITTIGHAHWMHTRESGGGWETGTTISTLGAMIIT